MTQPTAYQYVKLGSNLEFLRGISAASVMQTTSLAAFPNLMENFAPRRYAVLKVVNVLKSLQVQLEEMGLIQSLRAMDAFRPMLKTMEDYLTQQPNPQAAYLIDEFADRLVAVAIQIGMTVRSELGTASLQSSSPSAKAPG